MKIEYAKSVLDNYIHRIVNCITLCEIERGTMKILSQKRIMRFAGANGDCYWAWYVFGLEMRIE